MDDQMSRLALSTYIESGVVGGCTRYVFLSRLAATYE